MVEGTQRPAMTEGPTMTDAEITSRVDELVAEIDAGGEGRAAHPILLLRLSQRQTRRRSLDTPPSSDQASIVEAALGRGEAGSLLFVTDPAEINRLQRLAIEGNRLGIPVLFGFDVIHGLRTILPVPIAMAASWDPETIEHGQSVAAREARSVGLHWTFAPMVDIARDPRWGRIIEGAGEDPYLGRAVAGGAGSRLSGRAIGAPERVIAGPKHFAGYGAAIGGRDYDEVNLSDAELWNVYFPPFQAALGCRCRQRDDRVHGPQRCSGDRQPLAVRRCAARTFGFEGFVVSDANAVRNLLTHGFAARPDRRRRPRGERRHRPRRWRWSTLRTPTCQKHWRKVR